MRACELSERYSFTDEIKKRDLSPCTDRTIIKAYSKIHNLVQVACVLNHLDQKPRELILDAGCGAGRFAIRLAKDCKVVGTDFSVKSLEALREDPRKESRSVVLILCDVRFLPLRGNLVDRVICVEVLQHFPSWLDRIKACRDLLRVLRNGGRMVILVTSYNRKLMKKRAFKIGYGGTGIFRFHFSPLDLFFLVKFFNPREYHVRGSNNIPERLLRCLGDLGIVLDVFVSRLPISIFTGDYLILECEK